MSAPTPPVPSPCNSVCRMNADTGWCEGCYRTLDEIAAWARLDDDEKRAVWERLALRRTMAASCSSGSLPPPPP